MRKQLSTLLPVLYTVVESNQSLVDARVIVALRNPSGLHSSLPSPLLLQPLI